ncbi:hypothetical protein RI367_000758 [Sorochytrium milnesiophthora]
MVKRLKRSAELAAAAAVTKDAQQRDNDPSLSKVNDTPRGFRNLMYGKALVEKKRKAQKEAAIEESNKRRQKKIWKQERKAGRAQGDGTSQPAPIPMQTKKRASKKVLGQAKRDKLKEFRARKQEKERKQEEAEEQEFQRREVQHEQVRFGEVAKAPPSLKIGQRMQRMKQQAVAQRQVNAAASGAKKSSGDLSLAQKRILETEREKLVQLYRELKANRELERTSLTR